VIRKERRGEYLGKTVQVIPHITDEIKGTHPARRRGRRRGDRRGRRHGRRHRVAALPRGDPPAPPRARAHNACYMHLTLVPYIAAAGELKTKPTQHSVKELREIGIQPDILLCRTDRPIPDEMTSGRSPCSATCPRSGDRGSRDADDLQSALGHAARPGSTRSSATTSGSRTDRRPVALESHRARGESPQHEVSHRHRRQVRRPHRVVQEPQRGARPRRHRHDAARSRSLHRRRGDRGRGCAALQEVDGDAGAGRLRRAAPRARSPRSATPASTGCRSSASASACSWPSSSSPATSPA
jgi:hypothetical protein